MGKDYTKLRTKCETVIDGSYIDVLVIDENRKTAFEIDVTKRSFQRDWIGKKVGDTFLSASKQTCQILSIYINDSDPPPQPKRYITPYPPTTPIPGPLPKYTEERIYNRFGFLSKGINVNDTSIVLLSVIPSQIQDYWIYRDGWLDDGEYLYCGEGGFGDQKCSRGNLAIISSKVNRKPIHLITKFSCNEYYYQGEFELDYYEYTDEKDATGNIRKVYKFCLKRV